jgi:hypothetical protein
LTMNYFLHLFFTPSSLHDNGPGFKLVCVYHKDGFENRLTEQQKEKILHHHKQVIRV